MHCGLKLHEIDAFIDKNFFPKSSGVSERCERMSIAEHVSEVSNAEQVNEQAKD